MEDYCANISGWIIYS